MRRPVGLRWTEWHGEKHKELCSKNDFLIFRPKYGICQAAAAAAAAAKYFWNERLIFFQVELLGMEKYARQSAKPQSVTEFVAFFKWAIPGLFSFVFGLLQTNINTILQQINVKIVHQVHGAGIQTNNLQNMSLLLLDQGSHPNS